LLYLERRKTWKGAFGNLEHSGHFIHFVVAGPAFQQSGAFAFA
jgi:hypothetical protein